MRLVRIHADTPSALGACLRWLGEPAQHYLRIGLAISLLVHAAALAWRFGAPAWQRPPAAGLEVVLLNARSETPPDAPRVIAQNAMTGGGNASQGMASTPLPRTGQSAETIVLEATRQRQMQLEAEQARLMTQLRSADKAGVERPAVNPWPEGSEPGNDAQDQASVIQNAQVAALAARVRQYSAEPRKQFVAPSAEASRYAAYLDAWRSRIEAIGTRNYPDEARGRIYGSLRITVTVRSDGSIGGVEIDQPSPHAVLNQAARRIVQLAAPFPPFPPDIARDTDELVITRTWHFINDTLETEAP
ncbi:TonB family protein [Achromobacter sp. Marseille-Q4962]|uniref:TonB family protein n=1 Tax=Achromobacter sp. Marseille-Q4962 TaxID=2942202 RepID=UPI0020730339|nr:TonB family protein [Achromobacter sp. Marseille-Q4962]